MILKRRNRPGRCAGIYGRRHSSGITRRPRQHGAQHQASSNAKRCAEHIILPDQAAGRAVAGIGGARIWRLRCSAAGHAEAPARHPRKSSMLGEDAVDAQVVPVMPRCSRRLAPVPIRVLGTRQPYLDPANSYRAKTVRASCNKDSAEMTGFQDAPVVRLARRGLAAASRPYNGAAPVPAPVPRHKSGNASSSTPAAHVPTSVAVDYRRMGRGSRRLLDGSTMRRTAYRRPAEAPGAVWNMPVPAACASRPCSPVRHLHAFL